MPHRRLFFPQVLVAPLLAALACNALSASTATPPPPTALPLFKQVALESRSSSESGQPFGYTISLQKPVLVGSDDPRVRAFNAEMASIVDSAASTFKSDLANVLPTPVSASSTFDVRYELRSPLGPILSIQFEMEGYVTGAAHPFHTSRSVNFDLEAGRDLSLSELFLPGSDYLQAISQYCIQELQTRNLDFSDFSSGAAPTPDNYRNWNITASGLLVTFDEYQVGPYAAGPQQITVPYSYLSRFILDPGPLSEYSH